MLGDLIDKLNDLFYDLKFKFSKNKPVESKADNLEQADGEENSEGKDKNSKQDIKHDGGKIYALWRIILPVLLGLCLGWLAAVCLGVWLEHSGIIKPTRKNFVSSEVKSESVKKVGLDDFLLSNPFRISARKPDEPEVKTVAEEVESEEPEINEVSRIAGAVLRGTLPGGGAWIELDGKEKFVLINTSFDLYTLTRVSYLEAEFTRVKPSDNTLDRVILELYFDKHVVKLPPEPEKKPKPKPKQEVRHADANVPTGEVVAASDEQEGSIPSGMVNQLVQNPFDELKKVRLRPQGQAGLQIQWIQNDSILKKLGVKRGDVIKSINGIPFNNMADIANSINSLMNSERFDVEVDRRGKPTALRYVVH